jgi:DNA excision repair protein ERCC-4
VNRILLIADDRETVSGIPDLLAKMPEVNLGIERLVAGDYRVEEAVLIERKTASDFAQSLITGRLFEQAARMGRSMLRPAYILEGKSADWSALGVRREALQGALITLTLVFDIPVLRAVDAAETARLIFYAGQQLARLRDPNHAPNRSAKVKRKRSRQLRLLQTLPGVGSERAKLLLEHFGSIRSCFEAGADELQKIEGIGPKTAQAIWDTVHEGSPAYPHRVAFDDPLWI